MAIINQSETFLKNDLGPLDPRVAVKVKLTPLCAYRPHTLQTQIQRFSTVLYISNFPIGITLVFNILFKYGDS